MRPQRQPTTSASAAPGGGAEVRSLPEPTTRRGRVLRLLAGLILGQFLLYGPSLLGTKVLLPLDLLALPNVYLPVTAETARIVPHDTFRSDLIYQFETERRFVATELREGRFPLWLPYQYAGVPLVWPRFSPLILLSCLTASPVILAWAQLAVSLVAGVGAYLFFRRVLSVSFWAAVFPAWCFPLTGFLIFWQGFPTCGAVYWFPWLLLAVDRVARQPGVRSAAGLAGATALVLIGGHVDVAGQALLGSGLFGVWSVWQLTRAAAAPSPWRRSLVTMAIGWGLGFMLAGPHLVPLLDYARTGARMERRGAGAEERPPVGWTALPAVVLPDSSGATRTGSLWLGKEGNQIESSAAAYAGVVATLFAAPLAWACRRRRAAAGFFTVFALLGLTWCLNVPGLVSLLRLPGLNMMSHNRLVFWTAFGVLALGAIGLDALARHEARRAWGYVPATLLVLLTLWCVHRVFLLPEPLATQIGATVAQGKAVGGVRDATGVRAVQQWFSLAHGIAALGCAAGVAAWVAVLTGRSRRPWFVAAVGTVMIADLLWFARDRSAQCAPALDFPRIPLLEEIARGPAGRIVGFGCLPATLAQTHGLRDIRGYDSIDPGRLMRVLDAIADPEAPRLPYAQAQWFVPRATITAPDKLALSPAADLLDIRYAVLRGAVPPQFQPPYQSSDYWALVNPNAVGRIFVPEQVVAVADENESFARITAPDFAPRRTAYVESNVVLPARIQGEATIHSETPTHIRAALRMATPGLVVLTDYWDAGWRAYLDGRKVPILRTDYLLRGVVVPAGAATLEFRYEPMTLRIGGWLAGLAGVAIAVGWIAERRGGRGAGGKSGISRRAEN
jgi:hypothetical protein